MSENQGLYDASFEHDSCGIGFVANLKNKKSSKTIQDAIAMLENMEHRGGCGCEPDSGDGAGILLQLPHDFLKKECSALGIELPEFSEYGVAMTFFPMEAMEREKCRDLFVEYAHRLGFKVLGFRVVPTDNSMLGASSKRVEPHIEQIFLQFLQSNDPEALERRLCVLRKYSNRNIHREVPGTGDSFYISSS